MADFKIRPAKRSDLQVILERSERTWSEHAERQPYAFPQGEWELILKPSFQQAFLDARNLSQPESQNLIVAAKGSQILGYALLSRHVRDDLPNWPSVSIDDISVAADVQGTGVGRALIDHIKDRAAEENWGNLTAQVWAGNEASHALFAATGFTQQAQTLRFGSDGPARPYPATAKVRTDIWQSVWPWLVLAAGVVVMGLAFRFIG